MAESAAAVPAPTADDPLAALRARGAGRADPVRFRFLEALARRAAAQQGAARRLLDARLAQALADFAARLDAASDRAGAALAAAAGRHPEAAAALQPLFDAGDFAALHRRLAALADPAVPTPLAGLAARLAQHTPAAADPGAASEAHSAAVAAPAELKSLRYFRNTWSKLSVEQQLAEALAQAPENAGPLNSHLLVLRALERMRDVSPDYLSRFMAYADALLWLAQADGIDLPAERGAAVGDGERRKGRGAKPGR